MRPQRTRLVVKAGDLLELLGAAAAVAGVYRLVGIGFALVLAGVLAVAAAELIYDGHVWRVPLPRKPRPRARARQMVQRARVWWFRRQVIREQRRASAGDS